MIWCLSTSNGCHPVRIIEEQNQSSEASTHIRAILYLISCAALKVVLNISGGFWTSLVVGTWSGLRNLGLQGTVRGHVKYLLHFHYAISSAFRTRLVLGIDSHVFTVVGLSLSESMLSLRTASTSIDIDFLPQLPKWVIGKLIQCLWALCACWGEKNSEQHPLYVWTAPLHV